MPARDSDYQEKSPIEKGDYEGLQLDTRARDTRDKHLDQSKAPIYMSHDFDQQLRYFNEKHAQADVPPPRDHKSTNTTLVGSPSPITPIIPQPIDAVFRPAPEPRERRTCGLKRRHFWELFGLIVAVILAAAIVGGVVGGLQAKKGNSAPVGAPPAANSTNATAFTPLLPADVMVDSPLNVISYDRGGNGSAASRQSFQIFYQSAIGNIKEAVSNGLTAWGSANPIFTDAINNTGLATVTYLNGTEQQGSIYYVGMNGFLQEKRKVLSSSKSWQPGTLNQLNIAAVGNITLPSEGNDPKNNWDSYRIAAVYSSKFHSGPGARLFYHAEQLNGASFIQEVIWDQRTDKWSSGAQIQSAWPNSHLAATIDESTQVLRLFFSSGNNNLQEVWTLITDPKGKYGNGVALKNYLDHNSADLAAVSLNGTTYVYHYASANQTANVGIHELTISGIPNSVNHQESYNLSEPLVASPMLTSSGGQSLYQPLTACMTVVPGLAEQIYVFWADQVTGDPTGLSGYAQLSQTSRSFSNTNWPGDGQLQIPLGSNNAAPYVP